MQCGVHTGLVWVPTRLVPSKSWSCLSLDTLWSCSWFALGLGGHDYNTISIIYPKVIRNAQAKSPVESWGSLMCFLRIIFLQDWAAVVVRLRTRVVLFTFRSELLSAMTSSNISSIMIYTALVVPFFLLPSLLQHSERPQPRITKLPDPVWGTFFSFSCTSWWPWSCCLCLRSCREQGARLRYRTASA